MGFEALTAFIPAVSDIVKGLTRKFLGEEKRPKSVDPKEWVSMQEADTNRIKALSRLDSTQGTPSQWVIDLRQSSRYLIAAFVTFALILSELSIVGEPSPMLESVSTSVWFFLFGERGYRYLNGGK